MKTLANCTPREFFKQTNRIRISADEWLTATKILEIRKRMPEMPDASQVESKEELRESMEKRKAAIADQMRNNFFDILEAMLDTNADKTEELLALACLIESEDANNHSMSEYLMCLSELIVDPGVLSFFDSLVRLGVSNMANIQPQ